MPDVSSFLRVLTNEEAVEPLADIRVDADIVYVKADIDVSVRRGRTLNAASQWSRYRLKLCVYTP